MGLFLFVIIITSKNRKTFPIAFLMLAFSIILFQYVLFWTHYELIIPYFVLVPTICYLCTGPLLYLYFLNLYNRKYGPFFGLHFIPAVLMLIPNIVLWLKYLQVTEMEIPLLWMAQRPWLIVSHMVFYTFLMMRLLILRADNDTQYSKLIKNWSKTLIVLYALFIAAYASYYILIKYPFFNSQWDYAISITMSISIYTIGFFIFKQPKIFDGEFYTQLFLPPKETEKPLEQTFLSELFQNVVNYMNTKKPYVDNELRLVNLADQLGFSTHLLSKVINHNAGKNFNQFINDYRLEEAEKLLKESADIPIQNIYYEVGFNNKATFYSAFKKKFGCTPTQFRAGLIRS